MTGGYIRAPEEDLLMLKIAIVGPESSGKTVLAEALMAHYRGGYVSEPSRAFLEKLGRPYREQDLLEIARSLERSHADRGAGASTGTEGAEPGTSSPRPMFYDTDTLNIKIWSQEKYGRVHPDIERMVQGTRYTWRLLCRPDIPWVPDPLRENPYDRDRLFEVWERELRAADLPYTIIEGTHVQRMRRATSIVDAFWRGAEYVV